jgi:hypothetical protein
MLAGQQSGAGVVPAGRAAVRFQHPAEQQASKGAGATDTKSLT